LLADEDMKRTDLEVLRMSVAKRAILICWALTLISVAMSAPARAQNIGFSIWSFYVGVQPVPGVPNAKFTANLGDPAHIKARQGIAQVEVHLDGVELTNPTGAASGSRPQGHLHYRLDSNAEICTVASTYEFNGLTPGQHKIVVALVGNDHKPLGPQETFGVIVPKDAKARVFGNTGE
jgi:hypothetical protein